MIESVSTGIPKLDQHLLNGIPRGYTTLVKGAPGTGVELFAKQFASVRVVPETVVYFTTDEQAPEVISTMEYFDWPTTDLEIIDIASQYFDRVLAKEQERSRLRRDGMSVADLLKLSDLVEYREKKHDFLAEVIYEISNLTPPFRVIIDSLDFFLQYTTADAVLSAIRTIKAFTHFNKSVTLLTMVSNMHERRVENAIDAIVDCIIELEVQRVVSEFETRLMIRKVRNYPNKTAIMTYSVTEKGITPEMVSRVA